MISRRDAERGGVGGGRRRYFALGAGFGDSGLRAPAPRPSLSRGGGARCAPSRLCSSATSSTTRACTHKATSDSQMLTWMRCPTSVIGGKADIGADLSVSPLMTRSDVCYCLRGSAHRISVRFPGCLPAIPRTCSSRVSSQMAETRP
jgi:hypothetical protein